MFLTTQSLGETFPFFPDVKEVIVDVGHPFRQLNLLFAFVKCFY